MWQPHPDVKRMLIGTTRKVFGGFDHEVFYHNALFIGYNVTNTIYNTTKAGRRSGGLPQENV